MITITSTRKYYLLSALIILLFCFVLFSLDHETHALSDLFTSGNLVALLLYFIPTYLVCYLLYTLFQKKNSKNSFAWSLIIGIPVGFTLVIIGLSFWMGRLG